jgi:enoyl-CoA hydratase/carnithine racemase
MAELLTETHEHVRVLTLNRPERLNAITFATLEALTAALKEADADPAVRATTSSCS